ncbi:MAG TPA: acyl-CoA dehydrogenase [Candidatus Hydrogenedentes bacterium]|nr:acyl-CoA dehydrogenase [Candidatus Hydrogenedentota bacterium]
MDFSIPDELQVVLKKAREFVEQELYPLEPIFFEQGFATVEPELHKKRAKVKQMGMWLPQIEREHGGMGLSLLEHGLFSAEIGRTPLGNFAFNCQAPDSGNMELLLQYASPEQQEKYLKPLLNGDIRSCFGMTEPDFPGSNPVWMGTTAVKDGDDYVLNGRKWWTTGGDGATFCVVMAVTDPNAPPHFRASQILVPTDTPGFIIETTTPFMGHRGESWASHSEVRLDNCRVPQANRLGPEGAGFLMAQERLGPGRIHHCMRWIGVCERAFDLMCQYAVKRDISPDRPLASKQFIQGWIAESRAEIDAARLMVLHAAWVIDNHGAKAARDDISLIKFTVANTMMRVVDRALQAHGGLGVTDYTPLAMFYRMERAARIYDGTDEVHKLSVAKRILQRYA